MNAAKPIFIRPPDEKLRDRLGAVLIARQKRESWRTVSLNDVALEALHRGLELLETEGKKK